MEKITTEQAEFEVEQWLDFKKISQRKRANNKENIEILVSAIVDGQLILKENQFVQKLLFPVNEITELKYVARITVKQVRLQMQGVKSNDLNGMILGYACALTGQVKNVLDALDTEDYAILQSIAIFFLGN